MKLNTNKVERVTCKGGTRVHEKYRGPVQYLRPFTYHQCHLMTGK